MPPIEQIEKRTRNSKTHSLGGCKYSWDGTISSIHYEDNGWQEIDNYFESALAPWDWQMLHAGYHIRVKEGFNTGQILEFEKQGETVQFQPMALEWTNNLDMIQQISMPQDVSPIVTNPEVDLLATVGMPSHQGTIRWDDAYGEGIDFQWRCASTRLVKILEIESFNKLPVPEQYILDGGNPVLRLNLIFAPSRDVDIYVDGEVWDKKAKKQTFKVIEFRKDSEVLWGFMPLRYWGSGQGEDNEERTVATLEKRGNKLYISIRVPLSWLESAVYPVFIDTDVDEVIGAQADDFLDWQGTFYDNYLYAGETTVHSGLRWTGVTISGTIGANTYMKWQSELLDSLNDAQHRVYGIDEDNPAAPTNITEFNADPLTTEFVNWSYTAENYTWYQSPSLQAIFQELVDTYTISNEAVMIQIRGVGGDAVKYRDFGDSSFSELHIEYEAVAPAGQPTMKRWGGIPYMQPRGQGVW